MQIWCSCVFSAHAVDRPAHQCVDSPQIITVLTAAMMVLLTTPSSNCKLAKETMGVSRVLEMLGKGYSLSVLCARQNKMLAGPLAEKTSTANKNLNATQPRLNKSERIKEELFRFFCR